MSDCLFCKIVSGEVPADKVHEDDRVIAFRDINPQAPTHVLVIPRDHIMSADAVTAEQMSIWSHLLEVAQQIARAEEIAAWGYRMVTNVGRDGGQTVDHLHLHLLGGRALAWPPG